MAMPILGPRRHLRGVWRGGGYVDIPRHFTGLYEAARRDVAWPLDWSATGCFVVAVPSFGLCSSIYERALKMPLNVRYVDVRQQSSSSKGAKKTGVSLRQSQIECDMCDNTSSMVTGHQPATSAMMYAVVLEGFRCVPVSGAWLWFCPSCFEIMYREIMEGERHGK